MARLSGTFRRNAMEDVVEAVADEQATDEQATAEQANDGTETTPLPELAFSDTPSATRWMKSLPLSNVGQAYEALLGQLRALTASDIGPRERATIAELAREPVVH